MSPAQSKFRTAAARAAPGVAQETNDALLHATGPVLGERVSVIGHDAPGIVMDLACHSAAEITLLGPNARPEAATVDVAVVTGIACVGYAQRAVENSCSALSRSGRIVLQSTADVDDDLDDGIARALREAGFSGLRVRIAGRRVMSAPAGRGAARRTTGRASGSLMSTRGKWDHLTSRFSLGPAVRARSMLYGLPCTTCY